MTVPLDVNNLRPRGHIPRVLEEWNDDGTRNIAVKVTPPTDDEVPIGSNGTSQASAEDNNNTSREPTPGTEVTSIDNDSSADATHGGSAPSIRANNEIQHIWTRHDDFGQLPTTPSPTRTDFRIEERENIRRRSKNRSEQQQQQPQRPGNKNPLSLPPSLSLAKPQLTPTQVILHQQLQPHPVSAPITTTTRITLLIILTAISFTSFAIAIHTIHLAHQKATTLKHTKLTLLLTTHIVAICAAFGAVVVRRPPTEALLYFVVIVLLGNMVRREAECFL
jgi:hypothetical protein